MIPPSYGAARAHASGGATAAAAAAAASRHPASTSRRAVVVGSAPSRARARGGGGEEGDGAALLEQLGEHLRAEVRLHTEERRPRQPGGQLRHHRLGAVLHEAPHDGARPRARRHQPAREQPRVGRQLGVAQRRRAVDERGRVGRARRPFTHHLMHVALRRRERRADGRRRRPRAERTEGAVRDVGEERGAARRLLVVEVAAGQ